MGTLVGGFIIGAVGSWLFESMAPAETITETEWRDVTTTVTTVKRTMTETITTLVSPSPTPTPTPTPTLTPTPTPTLTPTTTNKSPMALVSVVRGSESTSRQALVEKAVKLLGEGEKLIPSNSKILIKPNVGFSSKTAVTGPHILEAVVNLMRESNPKEIVVADSSVRGVDTRYAFQKTGLGKAASDAGARVRDLREDTEVTVAVPKGTVIKDLKTYRTVLDSDYVISVPRLKRHSSTTVTVSLKNMMGTVPDDEKGRFHRLGLSKCIADLNTINRPGLVIIDAVNAMAHSGPTGGVMLQLNMVIASTDPVAADLTAAQKLFEAERMDRSDAIDQAHKIRHIQEAARRVIGTNDLSKIKVIEETIA